MAIKVRAEVEGRYLHLYCRGTYSLEATIETLQTAFDLAAQNDVPAVLVDCRDVVGDPPRVMERYEMGAYAAERSRGLRVAIVATEPMRDTQRLGENVAVNRGADLKGFGDLQEARAWLAEDNGASPPSA